MVNLLKRNIQGIVVFAIMMISMMTVLCINAYAAVDETEYNDDIWTANKITVGSTVYGVTDERENDYFKFTPPVSGTLKLTIYSDDYVGGRRPSDLYVEADVYDGNNDYLDGVAASLDRSSGSAVTFGVKYGHTYYIRIYGSEFNFYAEDIEYHFNIGYSIGKTSITSVTPKDNAFNVKWARKSKASFYQIRYTTKSRYEDYGWAKAKRVKVGKRYNTKTIRKLANKKRYYMQVRVARTIAGKTYYSKWSARRIVKTK